MLYYYYYVSDLPNLVLEKHLAGGNKFELSTMPFIIRGVSLLGVSSSNCPQDLRKQVWRRLGDDLHPNHITKIHTQTSKLEDLPESWEQM